MLLTSLIRFLSTNQQGCLCCLGGFFLCLTFSLDYSYPNLNTYVTSYMRKNGHNPYLGYQHFIFLTAAKRMIQGMFMFVGGVVSLKIGVKRSITLGCLILCAGYSMTYFTIDSMFPLVVFSVGGCHGLGFIFVYAVAIGTARKWFPDNIKGLMGSIVVSGYGFGSLIWIPLQTAFVNPDNINPAAPSCIINSTSNIECEEVTEKYFTDPELLEKVPYSFLLMGGIIGSMSVIGIILIKEPPANDNNNNNESSQNDNLSLSPVEVLKTRIFYMIWMGFFATNLAQGLLVNWQKTFGLRLVSSDHFHSNIGIITNICNGVSRIFWGLMYDKFGYKTCMLIIGVCVTVVIPSLPLLTLLEPDTVEVRLLWGLMMVILYSTFPGNFAVAAAEVGSAFGPKYYSANFGLLFSSTVVYYTVLIILSQVPVLFDTLDYTGMFLIGGAVGVVGVLVTAFMPKNIKSQTIGK